MNIKVSHARQCTGSLWAWQGQKFPLTSFLFLNTLFFLPLYNVLVHVIIMSLLAENIKSQASLQFQNCVFCFSKQPPPPAALPLSAAARAGPSFMLYCLMFSHITFPEKCLTEQRLSSAATLTLCCVCMWSLQSWRIWVRHRVKSGLWILGNKTPALQGISQQDPLETCPQAQRSRTKLTTQNPEHNKGMRESWTWGCFCGVSPLALPVSAAGVLSPGAAAASGAALAASAGAGIPAAASAAWPPLLSWLRGAAAPAAAHKLLSVSLLAIPVTEMC